MLRAAQYHVPLTDFHAGCTVGRASYHRGRALSSDVCRTKGLKQSASADRTNTYVPDTDGPQRSSSQERAAVLMSSVDLTQSAKLLIRRAGRDLQGAESGR
jgi:hypothetical protein